MRKLLISGVGVLSAFIVMGPAIAADLSVPKRERAASPAQTQQASSNWSGSQAGGSNGASSVNNNFVEPGAHNFFSAPCSPSCSETPFSFSGHPGSYIIGGFLGYRWQMGMVVVGVEGDVNWKAVMAALRKTGYSGFVSPEIGYEPKQPDQLTKASKSLDTILAL